MSSNKTVETDASVEQFIESVDDERRRRDSWGTKESRFPAPAFGGRRLRSTA